MTLRFYIRLAEIALVLLLATAVIFSWREARSDSAELKTQLAAANQALAATTGRQQDRDAKLTDVLAGIAAEKKAAATPDQLLAGIAAAIGLPAPLQLRSAQTAAAKPQSKVATPAGANSAAGKSAGKPTPPNPLRDTPNSTPGDASTTPSAISQNESANGPAPASTASGANVVQPSAPAAKIPTADLRPLYDYILDCKSCQAKLTASQADLLDEKSKTAILTKSRDDAVRAAKGGSLWKRTLRAAKWFAIGAAAGAIAAKAAR